MSVITGTLESYTVRGEFHEFLIGGVKCSTKKADVAAAAAGLIGQLVEADVNEVPGNTNPHTGQPYINRYLNNVMPAQGSPPPQVGAGAPPPQPAPTLPPVEYTTTTVSSVDEREDKIFRQVGIKVAAHFLPFLPERERTPDSLFAIAERFVHYFRTGQ